MGSSAGSGAGSIDVLLAALLALFALQGLRRGLLCALLDLAALGASALLALAVYPRVGAWLATSAGVPPALADAAGLLLAFAAAAIVLGASAAALGWAIGAALLPGALGWINRALGAAAGLLRGVVLLGLALRLLAPLPLSDELRAAVNQSPVALYVATAAATVLPYLESAFGQLGAEATRLAPPQPEGERRDLPVPRGTTTWPDPSAEVAMLGLLNQERSLAGLPALLADERLRLVARAHSEEMLRLAYFAHESPVTGSPFDRLRQAQVRYQAAGENLAYAPTVEAAHRGLMASPGHRRNILGASYRRVGIGVAQAGLWGRVFSQLFTD